MPCTATLLPRNIYLDTPSRQAISTLDTPEFSPTLLFVSNAPEQIGPGAPGTWPFGFGPHNLQRASIFVGTSSRRIRIFMWHISRLNQTSYWSVRARSTAGTGEVRIHGLEEYLPARIDGSVIGAGRSLACTHLFGSYAPGQTVVPMTGQGEVALFQCSRLPIAGEVDNPAVYNTVLLVMEIEAVGVQTLELRTVVSTQPSVWGSFAAPCVSPMNNWAPAGSGHFATHVWGLWPNANPFVILPTDGNVALTRGTDTILVKEFSLFELDSAESQHFSAFNNIVVAPDPVVGGNPACYGANVRFKIPIQNTSLTEPNIAWLNLLGRNTGDAFACAASVLTRLNYFNVVQTPSVTRPIPGSADQQNPLFNERLVNLTDSLVGGPLQAPAQCSGHIELMMAVAGGSATPVNLQYTAPFIGTNPGEGGGVD